MHVLWKTVPMGLQSYGRPGAVVEFLARGTYVDAFVIMGQPCSHDASQVILGQRDHKI